LTTKKSFNGVFWHSLNNNNDFKASNNDRLSQLGKLPNNTAFPVNNQRNFYEIKPINTRNIKEK